MASVFVLKYSVFTSDLACSLTKKLEIPVWLLLFCKRFFFSSEGSGCVPDTVGLQARVLSTVASLPSETIPAFSLLSSFYGSLSIPRTVPWQQQKPSRAFALCLMRPILTLCESSPLGSPCRSCWMTPLGLLAPLLLLSSVEEREYLGRNSSR